MDSNDDSELIVLAPMGALDAFTAAEFRATVAGLPGRPARVVIDLTTVSFLDSAGLGALVGAIRRVRDTGGRVAVAAQRAPARVLRTAGLDRIVTITDRMEEARAALERTDQADRDEAGRA
jgi:anti-sigma B factor antagonist